jgi:alpha-beta hydrolase superfamily lysophospholipase
MKHSFWSRSIALLIVAFLYFMSPGIANASETTMPPAYKDEINPDLASKYSYIEDGDYSKRLNIPTYEWLPVGMSPRLIILGIHGLTLHGRRFRVAARTLAVNGIGFVSMDMRGFGECYLDEKKQFSSKGDDRTAINYEKSYQDIVQLAKLIKEKYPTVGLIALGESLGCTFCVRLAAQHPDLITGIILSAPAVRINRDMYGGKGQIWQGFKALFKPQQQLNMRSFFAQLCSQRDDVQKEMLDDPLIRKEISIGALLSTSKFVSKTARWGKKTDPHLAVLILQGSKDGCVSAKQVTDLMNNMPSDDQTLAWRGTFGHLQLETSFMRAAAIDAIGNWLVDHSVSGLAKLKMFKQDIADLGGTVVQ